MTHGISCQGLIIAHMISGKETLEVGTVVYLIIFKVLRYTSQ